MSSSWREVRCGCRVSRAVDLDARTAGGACVPPRHEIERGGAWSGQPRSARGSPLGAGGRCSVTCASDKTAQQRAGVTAHSESWLF